MTVTAPESLTTRLLFVNLLVLAAVFFALAVSPAPVSFPESPWEAALLLKGAAAVLLVNALVLHVGAVTSRSSSRGGAPLSPSVRDGADRFADTVDYEVVSRGRTLGLVDDVLSTRNGAVALVVVHGWVRRQRFLVPLDEVQSLDHASRRLVVMPAGGAVADTDEGR